MMAREMFDAIHANIASIPDKVNDLVAGYDTGTPDIKWTTEDWSKFPGTKVHVDQGFGGAVHTATVQDIEPGAYAVGDIAGWVANSVAARPTSYVNQSELDAALKAGKQDIWLAAPGMSDTEALALMADNPRIVAVQNQWFKTFDRSIVGDAHWPAKAPVTPPPVTSPPVVKPPPVVIPPPPVSDPAVKGLRATPMASLAQVNIAWNSSPGKAPYEWQIERQTDQTWTLEQEGTTTATIASVHNLSPRQTYRFRVSNGTWTTWVTVTTP